MFIYGEKKNRPQEYRKYRLSEDLNSLSKHENIKTACSL